jgi:hypothetical protein
MEQIEVRVYKPKRNTRIKIGFTDDECVFIQFKRLNVYSELSDYDKEYFTHILKPKKSKYCITVLNVKISKDAFACIGHFFMNDFYHKFIKN